MTLWTDREACSGCTACMNACPHHAISMQKDKEGFFYPQIDPRLCVECGICVKTCPFQNRRSEQPVEMKVYGVKHNNDMIRAESTSGGVFTALSQVVLDQNGVVFGASYDPDTFQVKHIAVTNSSGLKRLHGAKYVQSSLEGIFPQVRNALEQNQSVLFSGTPCQCDGLRRYLAAARVSTDSLYLCDLVCHGVPSPGVWMDYLNVITQKSKLRGYSFRDKRYGWHGANVTAEYQNNRVISNTVKLRSFSKLYFANLISRPSCGVCPYANLNRCTDITIGDFWGIENANPAFDDKKGVSLLLIHTKKGHSLFEAARDSLTVFESNPSQCMQEQLKGPQRPSDARDRFWADYQRKGIRYVLYRYGGNNLYGMLRRIAYKLYRHFR